MNQISNSQKRISMNFIVILILLMLFTFIQIDSYASDNLPNVYGKITDKMTGEGLPYVYVVIPGTNVGTITDAEGNYYLTLGKGNYKMKITYMLYKPEEVVIEIKDNNTIIIDISLVPNTTSLNAVTVTEKKTITSDIVLLNEIKNSQNVASGLSSQQIAKSPDKNASEVIKRIPGVTIMNGRFIIVRGLSQRYNNVWINNAVAPASESNSRAFSFDFIPSNLIDNIIIYKNLSPDLPADFSGGFVKIITRDIPSENNFTLSYSNTFRTNSTFNKVKYYSDDIADYFGTGTLTRNLRSSFPTNLDDVTLNEACQQVATLKNDCAIKNRTAIPDINLSLSFTHRKKIKNFTLGQSGYVGYSFKNEKNTQSNNSYGIYNYSKGESSYSKKYLDTQYVSEAKLSAAYNVTLLNNNGTQIAFKNLLQNIGNDRITFREGENFSNGYIEKSREYLYSNKLTYSTQLSGSHQLKKDTNMICWTLGYGYLNNNQPDRKVMDARMEQNESSPYYGQYKSMDNDIKRYFQELTEHSASLSLDYSHNLFFGTFKPSFKTGIYSEYKNRHFDARNFTYKKSLNYDLPEGYFYLPYEEMFDLQYLRPDGFYLTENTGKADSYYSSNLINAAYFSINLAYAGFKLSGGLRAEYQYLQLDSYESDGVKPVNIKQHNFGLFPSANFSYTLKEKHVFRVVYGKTTNRPEFREIAPYVYYDFDSFSFIEGNPELKNAVIHNLDFRYEFYQTANEIISLGVFYKKFFNPIEITYYYTGSELQYTFINANSAESFGLELEVRKSLDFIKLKNFSLLLNASLIRSEVIFTDGSNEKNRPMQGQSPYIINAGLYYDNPKINLTFSILYNIIGKRIVAVGQSNQNSNEDIPNTYEMPFHSLDAVIQKKFGRISLNLGVQNILNQKTVLSQIGTVSENGNEYSYTQNTRVVKTGIRITAGVSVKLNQPKVNKTKNNN